MSAVPKGCVCVLAFGFKFFSSDCRIFFSFCFVLCQTGSLTHWDTKELQRIPKNPLRFSFFPFFKFFFFFGCPMAYGSSLARNLNPSHSCELHYSCGNTGSFNPLCQARDQTCFLALKRCHGAHRATEGTLPFFFFFFFWCTHGMKNFRGQGSNPHHSSNPSHCIDNIRPLTLWELLYNFL